MLKKTIDETLLLYKIAKTEQEKRCFCTLAIKYKLFVSGWCLRDHLENLRSSDNYLDYNVIMCFYDNRPIGISVVENNNGLIMFFVRHSYRRNGVGTRLLELAKEMNKNIHGSSCASLEGIQFFKKLNLYYC